MDSEYHPDPTLQLLIDYNRIDKECYEENAKDLKQSMKFQLWFGTGYLLIAFAWLYFSLWVNAIFWASLSLGFFGLAGWKRHAVKEYQKKVDAADLAIANIRDQIPPQYLSEYDFERSFGFKKE